MVREVPELPGRVRRYAERPPAPPATGPVTWSTAQTARFLRVSPETVLRLIRARELAAVKIGHLWRVPIASVGLLTGVDVDELREIT